MSLKRIAIFAALIVCLVGVIYWCMTTGKAYDVILENLTVTEEGVEYPALEAVHLIIDKQDPVLMLEGDRIIGTAVGLKHKITINLLDAQDNTIESRSFKCDVRKLGTPPSLNVAVEFVKKH